MDKRHDNHMKKEGKTEAEKKLKRGPFVKDDGQKMEDL